MRGTLMSIRCKRLLDFALAQRSLFPPLQNLHATIDTTELIFDKP
jgi:hypothetical protein